MAFLKRLSYMLILSILISSLAFGAELRKLTIEDLQRGNVLNTYTSPGGHTGHYFPSFWDNNAFSDNTSLFGINVTGDGTGSITGFSIPLYYTQYESVYSRLGYYVTPQEKGAKGDTVTDDTAAIQTAYDAAKTMKSDLFIPSGTYKTTSTLNFNGSVNVIASAGGGAIIQPSSAVTTAIKYDPPIDTIPDSGYYHPSSITGIILDGTNTTGAIGIIIGSGSTTVASAILDKMTITSFRGTNAIGLKIRNSVGTTITDTNVTKCETNVVLSDEVATLPTATKFRGGSIRESYTNEGILIKQGYLVKFDDVIIEGNKKEGLKIYPSSGAICQLITLKSCWFESNWLGDGVRTTRYSITVDGTIGSHASIVLYDTFMNISNSTEKALDLNLVYDVFINNLILATTVDNAIRIQNALSQVDFGVINRRHLWDTMINNVDNAPLRFAKGIGSINNPIYLTNNSATPSVASGDFFYAQYTTPTTITMLQGGYIGKVVRIRTLDNNITWDFTGTDLYGNGGVDWNSNLNDWLECVFDGFRWFCSIHESS